MIVNAGIIAVIFAGEYPDRYSVDLLTQAGIELKPFSSL